jgi:hypothetical protein
MATVDETQLAALVADVEAKRQALADASAANDAAQSAAQAAATTAAGTLGAMNTAHADQSSSIKSLLDFLNAIP